MTERVSEGRKRRAEQIEVLKSLFREAQGGVLTNFRGLDMTEMTELRRRFREKGVRYKVVKNTLTRIAVQGTEYQDLDRMLVGPIGIGFTSTDPIVPVKVAVDFSKDHDALEVLGGFMEGDLLSKDEVKEVSKLSGRQELMSQLLGVLNGPSQKLLGVLCGVPQKFLGVLQARSEQLGADQSNTTGVEDPAAG